jgi:putative ABC transport system permease protein
MHETRLAVRRLAQRRGVTTVSILTLAAAIGTAAATWSLLSAVLLRPLPVRDPANLVVVASVYTFGSRTVQSGLLYPQYTQIRDSRVFADVAAVWSPPLSIPVDDQVAPRGTMVAFVSGAFFDVLGVRVPIGRGLSANDDRRGAPPVAVLSDRYWREKFNADPAVIGRILRVGGKQVPIVGVAARGFRGLNLSSAPSFYLPLETIADVGPPFFNYFADPSATMSPTSGVTLVGRLAAGQSADDVTARIAALPSPGRRGPSNLRLIAINTAAIPAIARDGMSQFARLLGSTVALLLVIGCSTVGLLLLVRTEGRKEEFATCLALGATRAQLARSVVIEGGVLTIAAAALSPLIAQWLFSAVSTFQLPGGINLGLLELSLDARAIGVSIGSAALATLLIAVIAGAFGFRADVADSLRARAGATPRVTRRRTRAALLATQVAIALTLVAGTGLFARSLMAALDLNRRIDSARIVISDIPLASPEYTPARASAFFDDLGQRLSGNPVIASVATSVFNSGGMGAGGSLTIDGVPRTFPYFVAFQYVDASFFQTMRMHIARGRDFSAGDVKGAPMAAIVSESFGRMIAAGGNPIGRHIVTMAGGLLDLEIVGVTDDLFIDIRDAEPLAVYIPIAQRPSPVVARTLVFRAAQDAAAAQREVLATIRHIDPNLNPPAGLTLDERLLRQMAPQQFGMLVLGTLGAIAVLLTILGTYVLAETMAVMRMREMGIRAALGATSGDLMTIVIRETATLVGVGLVAGLLLAWLGASTIRAFLFRVQPLDPVTLGLVAAVILLVAIGVSLRPALRAGRVNLAAVLRAE